MAQNKSKENYEFTFYCELCDYSSNNKSHIDTHKKTISHLEKCKDMYGILKTNKALFNKYNIQLNIEEDDDKTMSMIRNEIIDKLSCQNILKEISESKYEVPLCLIHELTQFTHGKTEQTLSKICQRYLLNSVLGKEHIIQIIVTNKSLGETWQWKIRTKNKMNEYENIDVDILSSDCKSNYHNIDNFISKIMMATSKDELPNVLIVCFHPKRIDDILKLFKMFCGKTIMLQNVHLKFHLSFDEPDANIGLCSKFLKKYKDYTHLLVSIEFITATPYEKFWSMLQEHNIVKLINPHSINNLDQPILHEKSYDEYLDSYFQIKEHTHLACNYLTNNPLDYIEHVFENKYVNMNDSNRKIIFSPAHLFTEKEGVGSHEEIVQFYIKLGFTVFLSNGKFKGFIEPSGERTSIVDFNLQYNIIGELRDTMRKWSETYPNKHLAITGYWTIERGITFQTDGFNFTHSIISDYHKQLLNKLLQLIGRITGSKDYIKQNCIIICPQHIIDTVNSVVEKTIELRTVNPENYNSTDFSDKTSCIPVKLIFKDEEYRLSCIASITKKRDYKQNFHLLLKNGYQTGKIILEDRNNIHVFTNDKKDKSGDTKLFDDIHKSISNVKMYTLEDTSPDSRRFRQFNNAFNLYKPTSQSGKVGEYSIDLAKDKYEHNGFVHDVNIAWITFRHD